jgi:hypothetical protein
MNKANKNNLELEKIYKAVISNTKSLIDDENNKIKEESKKATNPLLLKTFDKYENADVRIMIYGQETNGWDAFGESTKDLIKKYEDCFNGGNPRWNTSFWKTTKELIKSLKEKNPNTKIEYLWNNIDKIGKYEEKGFVPHYNTFNEKIFRPYFHPVLRQELAILQPNYIIFFTGPDYDSVIDDVFSIPRRSSLKGAPCRELCEIDIPNIRKAYRTYHPGYLRRSGKEASYLKTIVEGISKEIKSSQ